MKKMELLQKMEKIVIIKKIEKIKIKMEKVTKKETKIIRVKIL